MQDDLKDRAQKFFVQLMGPQLEVLEAISPSPLPEIIEAFIAWLEKEMKREAVPFISPQPTPITPQPRPITPEPWSTRRPIWINPPYQTGTPWSTTVKDTAVRWAENTGTSFSTPAEAVSKYAKFMAKS